jgi:hypothetical protein
MDVHENVVPHKHQQHMLLVHKNTHRAHTISIIYEDDAVFYRKFSWMHTRWLSHDFVGGGRGVR